ncbi:PCI-domain-containing protein [Cristinia sonorae]|uniref:PCI-domain-containing protein n=1 Tax=Cristinia sonorae TaxID=1940300 RepID=A0A8K0XQX2_9AGAR|nr:PCI-domain-containing protein [Cristinia sonorae]
MDVDLIDETEGHAFVIQKSAGKRPQVLPIDDAHPFDLEAYISGYSGRAAVDRLTFIIAVCPSLAPQAFQLAITQMQSLRDTFLYNKTVEAYNNAQKQNEELPPHTDVAIIEQGWSENITAKNNAERTKLEVELKTYSSNMIKESIRMGHRDLGLFYRSIGEYSTSLKHYTKSREFCTTSQHILDMTLSILDLLMEQRNFAHIPTYVYKGEAALEAITGSRVAAANSGNLASKPAAKEKAVAERDRIQAKLDLALAMSYLGQGQYEKAAQAFLKVGPLSGLDGWAGVLIAPGDIAIYGTLCALATYSRAQIQAQLLENDNFGVYIEQEPYVRELIDAYMSSRFKTVLEILERYSTRHFIDIVLSQHVPFLMNSIREHALVLYFQPFASINLERMAAAFGWTSEYLEEQVVALIKKGSIEARVDRQNKVLKARTTDQRAALFQRALKSGSDMQSTNRKLLLRMRLQQADLVVKAPRNAG